MLHFSRIEFLWKDYNTFLSKLMMKLKDIEGLISNCIKEFKSNIVLSKLTNINYF